MANAIETKGLCKTYGEGVVSVDAVKKVSMKIPERKMIGIYGPSGSGKTTLLSMIGCLIKPTGGSLKIYGTEITKLSENKMPLIRKKYISFIFQGFNLFPALTAIENILIALQVKGEVGPEALSKAHDILKQVGLSDRYNFLPRDLSGGQKQRVSIARALATASPIILADEPTANLDHSNGRHVMEILYNLAHKSSKCVIVATHDIRITNIFNHVLHMDDGKIGPVVTKKKGIT